MKRYWKVGDLAKLTGLTVRTLRFYDQIGLFSPSGATESGHRLYNNEDVSRLYRIVSLKELGLSLDEVKAALTGRGIDPLEVVGLQMERVQEQIRRQQKLLDQLRHVSKLMKDKEQVTVDDFTTLLQAMKNDYEKPILNRQKSWEQRFGLLGMFLAGGDNKTNHNKEESEED
ncbi:MerR family transcriptional regulator [Paenibacillus sp. GCM10027627]|uniref:MerR family transcriptional regulator n=1 Tax=unclassified Paenibacillus TaxID=185978 RepID=UPI0036290BB0